MVAKSTSKRERTRAALLANAIAIFRRVGIKSTRLAEIAETAGVVPATLANHFPTKARLVETWLRGEIDSVLVDELGRASRLRAPLRRVCRRLAAATVREPQLRAEAWRWAPRTARVDTVGFAALTTAIRVEQSADHLRGDLPANTLAAALLDAIEGGLIAGIAVDPEADGPASEEEDFARRVTRTVEQHVDLLLDGARKRNERVRLPPAST